MAKEDEGYLLDGSGNRVLSGSGEAVRTGSYDDDKVTQNRRKAAEDKLAEDVQEKLRADAAAEKKTAEKKTAENKAPEKKSTLSNDGDVDESDRRKEVAASGPQRPRPARPGQSSSGRKPTAAKPAAKPSELTDKPSAPAAKSSEPPVSNSYRLEGAGRPKPAAKSSEPATSAGKSMFQRIAEKETIADKIRRRGEESLKGSGMKAGGSVKKAKGGSINGIAKRGLTKCKMR